MAKTEQASAPWSAETQGASNDTNRLKLIQWKSDPWKVHGAGWRGGGVVSWKGRGSPCRGRRLAEPR